MNKKFLSCCERKSDLCSGYSVFTAATLISQTLDEEEIETLAAFFVALGDTLSFMLLQRQRCNKNKQDDELST